MVEILKNEKKSGNENVRNSLIVFKDIMNFYEFL